MSGLGPYGALGEPNGPVREHESNNNDLRLTHRLTH
jgi:hypothetical protein